MGNVVLYSGENYDQVKNRILLLRRRIPVSILRYRIKQLAESATWFSMQHNFQSRKAYTLLKVSSKYLTGYILIYTVTTV